ncbi:MAG: hypothetical protein EDM77_05310 [Candidatus Jettenia sp. AMX1]|nr:MAG: hypothetical protein EDM77_05310 [Candidatus Jettenia sp. AMX1]MCE7880885.1 hypothetical protein [Candidatus Jettenia sp. AMX1]MCQ3926976.1 hypothetical protein [Candidatus Jettenia sp.]
MVLLSGTEMKIFPHLLSIRQRNKAMGVKLMKLNTCEATKSLFANSQKNSKIELFNDEYSLCIRKAVHINLLYNNYSFLRRVYFLICFFKSLI